MTLSAEITGAPAGAPSYVWKMSFGGDYWLTVSTDATASYLTSAAETVSFQVTVSYGSGESATSEPVSVAFVAAAETRQEPTQQEEEQEQETEAEAEVEKPAKPTGLTVTTVSGWLGALVDWDDVEGADDYLVRWRPAGPDQQLNDGLEPTSSTAAITVAEDGEYVVRVQACNEAGCGGAVAERFTVAPLPPLPPANFALAAVPGGFEVAASWDARDGATSYRLAWVSLEGTGLAGGSRDLTGTSATVEVAGSGEWQFQLQACNEGGCGATLVETVDIGNVTAAQGQSTAPPEDVLVDNRTQTAAGGRGIHVATFDMAQAFTAGTNSVLTSVKIRFEAVGATPPTFNLKLCTGSDSNPISNCDSNHVLTLSGTLPTTPGDEATFTHSGGGIELTNGTTYYVVLTTTAAGVGGTTVSTTDSDAEDFQQIGWSIGNGLLASAHLETSWTAQTDSWRMQVLGRAKQSGAPTLESLEIDGTKLIATFDRYLDSSAAPAHGQFGIKIGSGALQNATAISVSGKRVVLTVPTVTSGQTVTATYTKPGSGNKLKDVDGNEVAGFTDQAVTNLTGTTVSLTSAVVDGNRMTLTFDRSLKEDSGTTYGAFGYRVGGAARAVATEGTVVISGKQVTHEIIPLRIPRLDQTVLVDVGQPTNNKLKDAWDNDVPVVAISDNFAATNITPLVSNHRQTTQATLGTDAKFDRDQAQPFTTGAHSGGYTLTSVEIDLNGFTGSTSPAYTVSIHAANSDGTPGSTNHGTLTNPSALVVGRNTFTAPAGGIELKPNTTYFVVVDVTSSGDTLRFNVTSSDGEDKGASAGWSIGDDRRFRLWSNTTWKKNSDALKMAIRADYRAAPPADLTAPPEEVLVDNANQAIAAGRGIEAATFDMAQAFTTGTHQQGYVLNAVKIRFEAVGPTPPTFNLKLCTGSDSNPIATCDSNHGLTLSGALVSKPSVADYTFTASGGGINLTKGTTYYVVLTTTAAGVGNTSLAATDSDNEDFQEISWSIANGALGFTHGGSTWTGFNDSWRMQVLGRAKQSGAPTVESLEIDGTTLVATFDRALDASTAPALSTFGISVGGSLFQNPTAISVSGKRLVLTSATAATSGQSVRVTYIKPGSGNRLRDRDGNEVADINSETVSNLTGTSVSLSSAVVDGNRMTLTFDRSLKLDSGTNPLAFEYKVGSGNWVSARVDSAVISGKQVAYQLRNHQIPRRDQTVLVRYAQPANNKLKDAWDNDAPAVSSVTATNSSPLVSNHRQGATELRTDINSMGSDQAQFFTTGSNSDGYTLTSVDLWLAGAGGSTEPNFTVSIYAADADSKPTGASLGTLTKPSTLGVGLNTFTAPSGGINLKANTTYVVFADSTTHATGLEDYPLKFSPTPSDSEDGGASTGWSIGNARWAKPSGDANYPATPSSASLRMVIRGEFGQNAGSGTPDTTAPTVESAVVDRGANTVTITFDENLKSTAVPASWFFLREGTAQGSSATAVTISGSVVTLTFSAISAAADKISYGPSASPNQLQDPSGNVVLSFIQAFSEAAAPADLTATPGDAQVVLTWTDPADSTISKYQIRQSTDGGSTWSAWTDIPSSSATTTTHTVSSLTNATTYTFQVRWVIGTDNGGAARASATPAGQLVKNLDKNIGGAAGTDIVANDAAQAFRTGSNGPGYTLNYVILGAGGSGTPPPPSGYSVKVCNNAATNLPGATCTDLSEPAALAGGGADVFAASGRGIVLSASTTYWIVFDSDSGGSGTWELRRTTDDGEDSGAAAGFGIFNDGLHRARAGTSWATATNDSNPLKLGIFGYARTGPSALSDLAAVVSTGQAALSWTASTFTGVTKYQYRVSNDVGASWNPDWTDVPGGANATSYTVRNLTSGAIYTIQVRAVAGTLTGAAASVSATLPHQPAPAPSGLKAAPGDAQIVLTWTDPSDANISKYQVRQRAAGGAWTAWADASGSGPDTTTHTVSGLTNWTRHTIELRAVRGSESSLIATGRPASASATPNGPFLSTLGQTDKGASTDLNIWDMAQEFTTGSHSAGYTLTEVRISIHTVGAPNVSGLTAMICSKTTAGIPDYTDPDTHDCLSPALTGPTTVTAGTNTWSAGSGGINLSANTTYVVLLDGGAGVNGALVDVTADTNNEDAGKAAGWSIVKNLYVRQNPDINNTWFKAADGEIVRFALVGSPRTPAPVFVGGGGGGGGGAPARRTAEPSEEDFAWNVTRDIEELDGENEQPTGIWSDGEVLWVLENAPDGEDRLFAYSLADGKRLPERDLPLFNRNRSSNGIWSDDEVVWIADAQQGTLFAYDLASKERLPERDIELAEANRQPGGIWSDGSKVFVLNRNPSLFLYDQDAGELLAELELDRIINRSPRGIWSDGVTIWVSDDRSDQILAYRLVEHEVEVEIEPADGAEPEPADPQAEGQDEPAAAPETKIVIRYELVRHEAEDFGFRTLIAAGNSHPRGIWSDGEVMFVADAQDNRVYSYNLPGAIDARLASLTLSDIELDEFSSDSPHYTAEVAHEVERITVEATPAHEGATVVIAPADADEDPENGHQVAIADDTQIQITVTSEDESRTRTYTVALEPANAAPVATGIPAVELTAGGEAAVLNLADHFSDPDGDPLSYTVGEPSDAEVFSAAQADGVLTLTPLSAGTASFDVIASDGERESEPRTIEVTVETPPVEVRLTARRNLADWVELGLQVRAEDGSWQERILPRLRFIPASAELGRWIRSSAIEVGDGAAARTLRIEVRRLAGGWVEFALQLQAEDGGWNARSPQSVRVLLAGEAGQWRHSAPLSVGSAGVAIAADDGQPPSEPETPGVDVEPSTAAVEVRLAARPLASGSVEFGLQERTDDGGWEERVLPRLRFLQTDSEVGRWRVSSAIEVGEGDTAGTVRIAARRIANGAVEFALVIRNEDGSWSARLLPRARILRSDSVTGRWRYSTPLGVGSP